MRCSIQHVRGERGQVELLREGDGDDDALLLGRGQRRTRHLLPHLQVREGMQQKLIIDVLIRIKIKSKVINVCPRRTTYQLT